MIVLICDDDQSLLDVITKRVDWQEMGVSRVLTAENGARAKELIDEYAPDMVLSDIGMPLCDGIEVLKYIREKSLPSEFAFLTCYEDFEYAREAVRYGAKRYLTKPVIFEELIPALREMAASAGERKKRLEEQTFQSEGDHLVLNTLLRGIRDGMYGTDASLIEERLRVHRSLLSAETKIRLILIRCSLKSALPKESDEPLWRSVVHLCAACVLRSDSLETAVLDVENDMVRAVLFLAEELESSEAYARASSFVKEAAAYGVRPTVLISEPRKLFETHAAYQSLSDMLHRLRFQEGEVFSEKAAACGTEEKKPVKSSLEEEKILGYLKSQNQADYLRYLAGYVNQITRNKEDGDLQMTLLHHALLRIFYSCIESNQIDRHAVFDSERIRIADGTCESSSYEMIRYAGMLFERVQALMEQKGSSADATSLAKRYIQEHFRENVDRDMIAKSAHITPNYLSKLFHQETGMSLREYVNQLRVKEAKRLLLSTDHSVSEIAIEVGFDNISYFSTVFRKHTGISPVEWRENPESQKEELS